MSVAQMTTEARVLPIVCMGKGSFAAFDVILKFELKFSSNFKVHIVQLLY